MCAGLRQFELMEHVRTHCQKFPQIRQSCSKNRRYSRIRILLRIFIRSGGDDFWDFGLRLSEEFLKKFFCECWALACTNFYGLRFFFLVRCNCNGCKSCAKFPTYCICHGTVTARYQEHIKERFWSTHLRKKYVCDTDTEMRCRKKKPFRYTYQIRETIASPPLFSGSGTLNEICLRFMEKMWAYSSVTV